MQRLVCIDLKVILQNLKGYFHFDKSLLLIFQGDHLFAQTVFHLRNPYLAECRVNGDCPLGRPYCDGTCYGKTLTKLMIGLNNNV